MIDVCICTHDPAPRSLDRAIAALAAQSVATADFRVLIVDNRSRPPIRGAVLEPLRRRGIAARIVREETLGVARARLRAIEETAGDWILFVDDDNELAPDYLAGGVAFIRAYPEAGCFGGKSQLPPGLRVPDWAAPFLPYLAILDHGDAEILASGDGWGPWEPPSAGAFVHRSVLTEYARRFAAEPRAFALGRKGKRGLGSCEDSLMMRGAARVGRLSAYVPALRLVHHITPRRLRFGYFVRLMRGYGRSHMLLKSILDGGMPAQHDYESLPAFLALVRRGLRRDWPHSRPFALAQLAYHAAARAEYRRQRRRHPLAPQAAPPPVGHKAPPTPSRVSP